MTPPQTRSAHHQISAGYNGRVLSDGTSACVLRALRNCESKVLYRDAQGNHQELRRGPGLNPSGVHGTHCFMNLEARASDLPGLLVPPGMDPQQIDRVNLYVSPPRCGAPLHFDVRTVIIVQLAGQKLWQVSDSPAVSQPLHNVVADELAGAAWHDGRRIDVPDMMRFAMLKPGNWLLIPRASWHGTFSMSGSVSATLAFADEPGPESLRHLTGYQRPPLGQRLLC